MEGELRRHRMQNLRCIVYMMNRLNAIHRIYVHKAAVRNGLYCGQLPILEFAMENDWMYPERALRGASGISALNSHLGQEDAEGRAFGEGRRQVRPAL